MSPYTTTYDDVWFCSWKCGFKHKDIEKVVAHEKKVHGAIQDKEGG